MMVKALFCWLFLLVLSVVYDLRSLWAVKPFRFRFSVARALILTMLAAVTIRLLMVLGWHSGPNLLLGMLVVVLLAAGVEILGHLRQSRRAEKQLHRVKSNALPDRLDEVRPQETRPRRLKFRKPARRQISAFRYH